MVNESSDTNTYSAKGTSFTRITGTANEIAAAMILPEMPKTSSSKTPGISSEKKLLTYNEHSSAYYPGKHCQVFGGLVFYQALDGAKTNIKQYEEQRNADTPCTSTYKYHNEIQDGNRFAASRPYVHFIPL